MTAARQLPAALDSEQCLLSTCFIDAATSLPRCLSAGVTPAHFSDVRNQALFAAMLALHADAHPIDPATVSAAMQQARTLDGIGGWAYVLEVSSKAPTTAQTSLFTEHVIEAYSRREIIRHASGLVEACYSGDMADDVLPKISRLTTLLSVKDAARTWPQAVEEAEALTRERMKPMGERNTAGAEIGWGLIDFDRFFQPLEPGELVIIGGYTSSGKSSLLRQVLWAAARSGHASLLETIEVRDAEEAVNLAGHISGVRSRQNLDKLHPKDQEALLAAFKPMKAAPFAVIHQDHNLDAMLARARAFKAKHGLHILGVDYLQIMENVKRLRPGERPDFAIGVVTSELKRFATNENCVVVLLSGFNRQYISDGNREPRLSDLDGSSSIEKDASRVILLDVPTEYTLGGMTCTQNPTDNATDAPRFFTKAIQAKGRNQGTASVGLFFRRETKTFQEIQPAVRP
jgi:replicative DNA helicase